MAGWLAPAWMVKGASIWAFNALWQTGQLPPKFTPLTIKK